MAFDHGIPSRNTTTVLTVTVLDKNDNSPVINGGAYITTNISEVSLIWVLYRYLSFYDGLMLVQIWQWWLFLRWVFLDCAVDLQDNCGDNKRILFKFLVNRDNTAVIRILFFFVSYRSENKRVKFNFEAAVSQTSNRKGRINSMLCEHVASNELMA